MSLSHIRNRIEALERRLALPLAVVTLRPLVEEFCEQWHVAAVDRKPLPDSHSLARKISERACSSTPLRFCTSTSVVTAKRRRSPIPRASPRFSCPAPGRRA